MHSSYGDMFPGANGLPATILSGLKQSVPTKGKHRSSLLPKNDPTNSHPNPASLQVLNWLGIDIFYFTNCKLNTQNKLKCDFAY